MAQQLITNNEKGLNVRGAINGNFTELYGAVVLPVKLLGLNANAEQQVLANTYIREILVDLVAGTPTICIGTTPAGTDILDVTDITQFLPIIVTRKFSDLGIIYITFSNAGTINVAILQVPNIF